MFSIIVAVLFVIKTWSLIHQTLRKQFAVRQTNFFVPEFFKKIYYLQSFRKRRCSLQSCTFTSRSAFSHFQISQVCLLSETRD